MNEPSEKKKLVTLMAKWQREADDLDRMTSNQLINSPDYFFFSGQQLGLTYAIRSLREVLCSVYMPTESSDTPKGQDHD
jgi:hypothetical protein